MSDEIALAHTKAIGGSMIAGIMGLSPWATPYSVWANMTGLAPPTEQTPQMRRGVRFESTVLEDLASATGFPVTPLSFADRIETENYGFPMVAALDAYVVDEDGVQVGEAKTTSPHAVTEWFDRQDEVPLQYFLQVQWYIAAKDCRRAYVGVRWGLEEDEFLYRVVERDQKVVNRMFTAARIFWNEYVLTKEPPPVTGKTADVEAVKRVLRVSKPASEVALPLDTLAHVLEYEEAAAEVKASEERKSLAENRLKLALGQNEVGTVAGYRVTWKTQQRRTVDTKLFKEQHPELAAKYEKKTDVRVFKVGEVR